MIEDQTEILARLSRIEERLDQLESQATGTEVQGDFVFVEEQPARPAMTSPKQTQARTKSTFPVTQILGWSGVLALVMAAAYLIKLGIDLGWLTPARQVMLAFLGGCSLVVSGLVLRHADRQYSSLLPAGGIAIMFLSTYGAHLYYRLIDFPVAFSAIVLICVLSLWLCHHFASELYAYFAIVGSYTAPLMLTGLRAEVTDLAIYYSAWSLLYCAFGLWFQQRRIYLVAAYLSLLGFDLIWYQQWHNAPNPQWQAALIFQAVQFMIFALCTALYTLRHNQALDRETALGHLPPLLLFYTLEYSILDRYLHAYAPWIALGSLAVLLALFLFARASFRYSLEGGQLILSAYAAIVLFHAGYLELLPDHLAPWAGLGVGLILAVWIIKQGRPDKANWPLLAALGLVFVINALRSVLHFELSSVAGGDYLALAYAAELYAGYFFIRKTDFSQQFTGAILYTGHLSAMAAPVHLFDDRLPVSLCWALLAVIALFLALKIRDKLLAQSSLFIFAISGAKVLLYDLDRADPLIRIGCLVILGISFYVGGWLYRKVDEISADNSLM